MKICFVPVTILFACSFAAGMNNSDVLRMVRGTAPTSVIIEKINGSDPGFTLDPSDIRHLREQHVPDAVIDAMIVRNRLGTYVLVPNRPPPPPPSTSRVGKALIVKESTQVRLRLLENLSSAYLRLDDKVHFEVLQDVLVDGFLVIKREASAEGTITAVNPTKVMGRYGTVEVALDHVQLANRDQIALRGTERGDRHIRPGLVVFLLAPIGVVVQPKDPVWLTPLGKYGVENAFGSDSMVKDGRDFLVFTDGIADLDSSEFEQR